MKNEVPFTSSGNSVKVAFVVMVFKSGNLWITSIAEWGIWREEMFCGLMKDTEKKKII